ncbi:hypothetical protein, partial [Micromonospora sp. WMMD736]|uniref:hypothetical protein n=1 Tax=Micromonospora sp. WMMD736 TaxID=3404112 RepID=UPI003B95B74C
DEFARNPEKALESTLTGGGFAEALEDGYEARHRSADGVVTPLRRPRRRGLGHRGDSSDPRVSKTS